MGVQRATFQSAIQQRNLRGSLIPNSIPITTIDRNAFSIFYSQASDFTTTSSAAVTIDGADVVAQCSGRPWLIGVCLTITSSSVGAESPIYLFVDGHNAINDSTARWAYHKVETSASHPESLHPTALIGVRDGQGLYLNEITPGTHRFHVGIATSAGTATVFMTGVNNIHFWGHEI